MAKPTTVSVIRYLRKLEHSHHTSNLGGITFVFTMDYEKRTVDVYFSVCNSKENFNKKDGIKIALAAGIERKLDVDKFRKLADIKGGFVDAYIAIVEIESVIGSISKREKVLLRDTQEIITNRH